MKKICIICMTVFLFVGCGNQKMDEWENEMKKYATIYYEEYMKNVGGQEKNEISIQALKNANTHSGQKFELEKLKSCKDTSYVVITVDSKTRKIQDYTYHLDCK